MKNVVIKMLLWRKKHNANFILNVKFEDNFYFQLACDL